MLAADKQLLLSNLKQNALTIREKVAEETNRDGILLTLLPAGIELLSRQFHRDWHTGTPHAAQSLPHNAGFGFTSVSPASAAGGTDSRLFYDGLGGTKCPRRYPQDVQGIGLGPSVPPWLTLSVRVCLPSLIQFMFFLSTVITLASELHCVCNTTFITIWGE